MMKLQAGNVSLLPENRPGRNMNKQHVKQQSDAKIKLIILAVIFFLFALIYVINPGFYRTMYYLSVNGDLNGTISYLRSFGPYAVLVSILLDVLVNVSGVLPSIFISTANALVFGLFWGFILSWLSEVSNFLSSDASYVSRPGKASDGEKPPDKEDGYVRQLEDCGAEPYDTLSS